MENKKHFLVLAIAAMSIAVKVDMQGTLSLGKEVLDTISYYLRNNYIDGRRSISSQPIEEDDLTTIVNSANFCRNLGFCERPLAKFIREYVITLALTTDNILYKGLNKDNRVGTKPVFKQRLKHCVRIIKKMLKSADDKISESNEVYVWTDIIKKISATFQIEAISLVSERLKGIAKEIGELKKKLTQKLVVVTVTIEATYQTKLCSDHNICIKSYECTKALNSLLEQFTNMSDDKVKQFMKSFYEILSDTTVYRKLDEVTANEFQVILNDMTYSNGVATKDVLTAVQKTMKLRLDSIESSTHVRKGRDVELVHMILSDMDHLYSKQKREPFYDSITNFYEWTKMGGSLTTLIRQVVKDISQQLSDVSDELIIKLISEVRVFLEITVDPEK